jgi:hypothetical protein
MIPVACNHEQAHAKITGPESSVQAMCRLLSCCLELLQLNVGSGSAGHCHKRESEQQERNRCGHSGSLPAGSCGFRHAQAVQIAAASVESKKMGGRGLQGCGAQQRNTWGHRITTIAERQLFVP